MMYIYYFVLEFTYGCIETFYKQSQIVLHKKDILIMENRIVP